MVFYLLPHLSSLSSSEIKELIISVDQVVTFKTEFTTLFKSNSSALGSPTSLTTSSFTVFQRSVLDDFAKLGLRVSLIQDNIGQDPGIADFPLRNPWEGLAFLKSSFSETVSKILPVLKQMTVPLSLLQVQSIVVKSLQFPLASLSSLQSKVLTIEGILSVKLPPLERLYAACSGGGTKPPAVALASRLNIMSTKLATLSVAGVSSLSFSHLPPPPSSDSTRLLSLEATARHLTADHKNLQVCIGNNVVDTGGVMFESDHQTTIYDKKFH